MMFRSMGVSALFLFALGCSGGGEEACETGAFQCGDGEILEECVDGAWTESEDCAADGLICHAEMGHCMAAGTDTGMTMPM
jgi:hypothetical protein